MGDDDRLRRRYRIGSAKRRQGPAPDRAMLFLALAGVLVVAGRKARRT